MAFHTEGRARVISDRLRSLQITDGPRSTIGRIHADRIPEIALRIASSNHNELTDGELRNFVVNFTIRNPIDEQPLAETERVLHALRGRPT
jgi:hypothetical protein